MIDINNLRENQFYIKGNVPSSKNGRACLCLKRGAGYLKASASTEKYLAKTKSDWLIGAKVFKDYLKKSGKAFPLKIRFTFIRDSKRSFDWVGPLETVQDCMSGGKFKKAIKGTNLGHLWAWIPDDSTKYITPIIDPTVVIDKIRAGVIIEVL